MSHGHVDDPHFEAAWRAYAEQDRRLAPAADLERRILERCQGVEAPRSKGAAARRPSWMTVAGGLSAAATVAIAVWLSWPRTDPPARQAIEARAFGPTALAGTAPSDRPVPAATTRARHRAASMPNAARAPLERPEVVMMFDALPLPHEPVQLVRLRLPREALQGLGLALLEPDAGGIVDVEVLVGEDGLPRDIRTVRIGREQR